MTMFHLKNSNNLNSLILFYLPSCESTSIHVICVMPALVFHGSEGRRDENSQKGASAGAPGWLSQLGMGLLIWAQVMISGS